MHIKLMAILQRGVVLQWFYSLNIRITFVEGTCAIPSALLVSPYNSAIIILLLSASNIFTKFQRGHHLRGC